MNHPLSKMDIFSIGELKINLGSGRKTYPGFLNIDKAKLPETNFVYDMEKLPLPFSDNSVSEIICEHVLEHLDNFPQFLEELYRITKQGGIWRFVVPYYKYEGTFRDPTHKCFFSENTFDYFTEGNTFDYYSCVRLKILRKVLRNSSKTNIQTTIKRFREYIPFKRFFNLFLWNIYSEVYFELKVVKENRRENGEKNERECKREKCKLPSERDWRGLKR